MKTDTDILRAAHRLIEEHGVDAVEYAWTWADECNEAGDDDGEDTWRWIARTVEELLSDTVPGGAKIH